MPIDTLVSLGAGTILVGGLSALLWELGKEMSDCPISGAAARASALGVFGAFGSMGIGVVALIAVFSREAAMGGLPSVLISVGACGVALGVGFSVAATCLRDSLLRVRREAREDATAAVRKATAREAEAVEAAPIPA